MWLEPVPYPVHPEPESGSGGSSKEKQDATPMVAEEQTLPESTGEDQEILETPDDSVDGDDSGPDGGEVSDDWDGDDEDGEFDDLDGDLNLDLESLPGGLDEDSGLVEQADGVEDGDEEQEQFEYQPSGLVTPWWVEESSLPDGEKPKKDFGKPMIEVKTLGGVTRLQQRFANSQQYLNYVFDSPSQVPDNQAVSHSSWTTKASLGLTFDKVREFAEAGWKEGRDKVDALGLKLVQVVAASLPQREIRYDVTGEQLDIGRFVAGVPEEFMYEAEMEEYVSKPEPPKVVRIVTTVDIAGTESFIMRGVAICALTQLLELSGFRVQVDVHIGTNNKIDTWLRIKDAEWPINVEDLVFYTAHPAMFYRTSYACWERTPKEWRGGVGTDMNFGWISEPVKEEQGDVYVSAYMSAQFRTEEQVMKWLIATLKARGIEIEEGQIHTGGLG